MSRAWAIRNGLGTVAALSALAAWCGAAAGEEAAFPRSFQAAKTFFQTNVAYDPRLGLAVDAVVVHRHGDPPDRLRDHIRSWKAKGYPVGRMFFADSDATNEYWTGRWDGTPRPEDVERNAAGEVVKCAGVRPYMLPTEGWIRYLEEMTEASIDAGADAILPEEPLAHAHTGYEQSFRELWEDHYGEPWEPESASPYARFRTAQLKNELYIQLETRLAELTRRRSLERGRPISFVLPIHSMYSNVAAGLVAPLGTSLQIPHVDGYIGQVWTGPVRWALANYGDENASFFTSAYALYDYFVSLTTGTERKLWLLIDPVEDDPNHAWSDFEGWYRHCVVATLMFPEVDAFEVMPWPDRIFLPGYQMGGGTPAPEDYRVVILSVLQMQQELPLGGRRGSGRDARLAEGDPDRPDAVLGIGVAVADTLLWEQEPFPPLAPVYGLFMPLLYEGVPVRACVLERYEEPAYLEQFRVIVLSYEAFKPISPGMNVALADWVRHGGSLIVLGAPDDLGGAPLSWREAGHPSPLHHLLEELGVPAEDGDTPVGRGWCFRRGISPRAFASASAGREHYLPLVEKALRAAGGADRLDLPGHFIMHRGPFLAAHASTRAVRLDGQLVDLFDPDLPLREGVELALGESGLYRDVTTVVAAPGPSGPSRPTVLHATHRLMRQEWDGDTMRLVIRGPAETPGVVRLHRAGRTLAEVSARESNGEALDVDVRIDGPTVRLRFPNVPDGVTLVVQWEQ